VLQAFDATLRFVFMFLCFWRFTHFIFYAGDQLSPKLCGQSGLSSFPGQDETRREIKLEILAFIRPAIEDALRIFTFESNTCQGSLTT
jgi:hypothetical protein